MAITDPVKEKAAAAKKAAETKALGFAKAKQEGAGLNTGDSSNKRTFSGTAAYVVPGQKVERFANTPQEIKIWKSASPESKAKYKAKSFDVTKSVSDLGADKKVIEKKQPERESRGYYSKGSNAHNMDFGGHSTSTYSKKPHVGNTSYTNSPSNPKSGRPNTFESRELTEREATVKKSRFSKLSANPFDTTESGWNNYLTKVEGAESKLQAKVAVRNKFKADKKASLTEKRVALTAKQDAKKAKMKAFKESKRNN
tara:strand:- start:4497 stop:5261 length:765 start_codon:yes stop_codon:yes gene_type:complete